MFVIGFLGCAVLIFFAGRKLSVYGDQLAETTGISKGWIGIILMASVTSLPELMVGISSVALVASADLAVGDIIGSCAFNLGILAILDALAPSRKSLFGIASQTHILNAGLGIILISMVGLALYIPHDIALTPGLPGPVFYSYSYTFYPYGSYIKMKKITSRNNVLKTNLQVRFGKSLLPLSDMHRSSLLPHWHFHILLNRSHWHLG